MCHKYTTHLRNCYLLLFMWRFALSEPERFCHKPEWDCTHIWKRPEVRSASFHFVKCSSGSAGDAFIWQKWSVSYEMYSSILIQQLALWQSVRYMSASLKSCQHRFWTGDGDRVGLGNPWGPSKWEDACIYFHESWFWWYFNGRWQNMLVIWVVLWVFSALGINV